MINVHGSPGNRIRPVVLPELGSFAIGDIVKISVGGATREFIIVQHGKPSAMYDDSFNDATTLLMKDVLENRQWHSSNVNDYANSTIHAWLNGEFIISIAAMVREKLVQVKIPYRPGSGTSTTVNSGSDGLPCKVFLISMYEVGYDTSWFQYMPVEGAKMSFFIAGNDVTAQGKRIAYRSGSAAAWWLRTPVSNAATNAVFIRDVGISNSILNTSDTTVGPRPAFVLPSTAHVNESMEVVP